MSGSWVFWAACVTGAVALLIAFVAYGNQKQADRKLELDREKREIFGAYLAAANRWWLDLKADKLTHEAELAVDEAYARFAVYASPQTLRHGMALYLSLQLLHEQRGTMSRAAFEHIMEKSREAIRLRRYEFIDAIKREIEPPRLFRRPASCGDGASGDRLAEIREGIDRNQLDALRRDLGIAPKPAKTGPQGPLAKNDPQAPAAATGPRQDAPEAGRQAAPPPGMVR